MQGTKNVTEEAQIRALRNELTSAIEAKDVERVLNCFADEPVMFILSPPLQFKGEEGPGSNGIREWFKTFAGRIGYEVRDLEISAGSDVAFGYCLIRISGERTNGERTDMWVRETLGFRKVGGQWRIAHQHQSVPMLMDGSNRAAVDLKP